MVEQYQKEMADRKEEEAKILDDFFGDDAIDAMVGQVESAFTDIAGPEVKPTVLLDQVLTEVCLAKESRKEFSKDLLENDEMIGIGVFGDEYEK